MRLDPLLTATLHRHLPRDKCAALRRGCDELLHAFRVNEFMNPRNQLALSLESDQDPAALFHRNAGCHANLTPKIPCWPRISRLNEIGNLVSVSF
jgi:hypothetical protein